MKNTTPQLLDTTKPILTNDLKKGHRVVLANGWNADIADNAKGQTRMAKVYGTFTEIGSVYSHDIAYLSQEGQMIAISHTDKQLQHKKIVRAMGM